MDFYPSISQNLLENALTSASKFDTISKDKIETIMHAKKSLFFNSGNAWGKHNHNFFDMKMWGYDGAETCEQVGAYILKLITQKHEKSFRLYKDDGLGVSNTTPKEIENMKKDVCKIFSENGLRITIKANKKSINFLDTTLNLNNKTLYTIH